MIYLGALKTSTEKNLSKCIAETEKRVLVQVRRDFQEKFVNDKHIAQTICNYLKTHKEKVYAREIKIESHVRGLVLLFETVYKMNNFLVCTKVKRTFASDLYDLDKTNGEKDYKIKFFELASCYNATLVLRENFLSAP